jgi:HAD superfamily hydrolase (TIGR01509 family)
MDGAYDAVVYDLDGTLVRLAVDWEAAHREVVERLESSNVDTESDGLWRLLERSRAEGFADRLEATLSAHERRGARNSERLPTADQLPRPVPVGVCSLNSESACRLALDEHGLGEYVDAVVGRDTVETHKPDPEPLLATARRLGADPERTLFVGDTERDERTADRAGVQFRFVG